MAVGEQRVFWETPSTRCILFKTKDGLEVRYVDGRNLIITMSAAVDADDAQHIADAWRPRFAPSTPLAVSLPLPFRFVPLYCALERAAPIRPCS